MREPNRTSPGPGILVSGGAGYIGSHTCKRLAAAGFRPVVIDNLSQGHRWAVKWGPLIESDIAARDTVKAVVARHDVVAAIHFAAHAYVGESMRDPRKYFHNNVANTLAFFDALVEAGVKNVVFSSSCATYGIPGSVPITETEPQIPINPYGSSKLMGEDVLRWYGHAYGLRSLALRYFNAAGADPDGELGEEHDPETHLIPLVIFAAQRRRAAVEVFGTDYPTPDGTAVRDYVHVTDLAEAHVAGLRYLLEGGATDRINIGTGQGSSIRQVIGMAERVSGRTIPVRSGARRAGDPAVLVADASRAKAVLGWQPKVSRLEMIMQTAWRWHEHYSPASLSLAG